MPPKKAAAAGPSKKNEQKKKEKLIEDKTFGLKNKKGAQTQKYIKNVQVQVQHGGKSGRQLEIEKLEEKKKKDAKAKDELADLNKLFRPVAEMNKIAKDVDPKSVVCAFFKQGLCTKGDKCKFSHDLTMERKTEKRNVYVDKREVEGDTMDNWDEQRLEEVVNQKHGEKDKNKPKTDIICKYFLEALENNKYGWFWECPTGDNCIYRHALPAGFVLKKDKKKMDELNKQDEISLEDLIEKERAALSSKQALTKVTLESFLAWKKRKIAEKKKKAKDADSKKRNEFQAGKQTGLSGRDLFTFNPELILQDDDEADDDRYEKEEDDNEENEMEAHEIDDNTFKMGVDEDEEGAVGGSDQVEPADPGAFNEALFDDDDIPEDDDDLDGQSSITNGVNDIRLKENDRVDENKL